LQKNVNTPLVKLCKLLVQNSNEQDGQDNISTVLIKILPPRKLTLRQRLKKLFLFA